MFYLVQLVKLALELDEVLASVRVGVNHTFLELFEGVDDLKEVSLREEVIVVAGIALFENGLWRNDKGVLLKVLSQRFVRVVNQRSIELLR